MVQVKPATRARIQAILGPLPANVWSTWADEIRAYDKSYSKWHHIKYDQIDVPCNGQENIKCGIQESIDTLRGKSHRIPKDVALKLLLHLVADAHQPLHVSMPGFYNGKCFFRTNKVYSFHRYMDYDVIRRHYRGVGDIADIIASVRKSQILDRSVDISGWLKESAALQFTIMPDLKLGQVPNYCKVGKDNVTPVTLSAKHTQKMSEISWMQLAKASSRMASLLDSIFTQDQG